MNCVSSHRFASWSYTTTGSPSLWVAHSLFVPSQSWLIGVDGRSTLPLFEYTAKSLLTIWTYCVAPTSPFVSGGRQEHELACEQGGPNGRQMPSKLAIGAEIGPDPFCFWTTGSLAPVGWACGCRFSLSRDRIWVAGETGRTGKLLTSGEEPSKCPVPTIGFVDCACVELERAPERIALEAERAMPPFRAAAFDGEPTAPKTASAATATTTSAAATSFQRRLIEATLRDAFSGIATSLD